MSSVQDEREAQILRCWRINAAPWSRAIRSGEVLSRELVTNDAILHAMTAVNAAAIKPASESLRILDVGCGEGWLTRKLQVLGMRVTGIDAVAELTAQAQQSGAGEFHAVDYSAIAARQWRAGPFDAAVCNFSLLGYVSVEQLVAALPGYLVADGHLVIQTLHPVAACGEEHYQDGWRAGNWCGFNSDFSNPGPWYFRTIESWVSLLARCGFDVTDCREPKAANATMPMSIIWICKLRGAAQTLSGGDETCMELER